MGIGQIKLGGVVVGAAAAVIGTALLPALGGALKSLTKSAIKGGLLMYQGSRQLVDKTSKAIDEMASEVKAELKESDGGKTTVKKRASAKTAPKKKAPQAKASAASSA